MRNLNRKDAILLWRKSRKHWILALMCLAVTLSAAVMPREAYAEAETEAAETESEESIREEANIGNVTNGVSVVATSEPGSNEQTGKKVSIKTGAVKNKNAEFMESKGFATFAILAAGGDTGDPSGKNLGPYQTDAKLYDEHGDEIPTGGTVIVGQHYTYKAWFSEDAAKESNGPFEFNMFFELPSGVIIDQQFGDFYDKDWSTEEPAGKYHVGEDGKVYFEFYNEYLNDEERTNRGLELSLGVTVTEGEEGGTTKLPWKDGQSLSFTTDTGADAKLTKTDGEYLPNDPKGPSIKYKVELEITKGMVNNPSIKDEMPAGLSYQENSAEIVVYDKDGVTPLDISPKPTLKQTEHGWEIQGLPSPMYKGQKVVVEYKCDVDLNEVGGTATGEGIKATVENKAVFTGKEPGKEDPFTREDKGKTNIDDTRVHKSGKVENDKLDWEIEIGSGSTDMRGETIKDRLTGNQWIDESQPLELKWKDENGNNLKVYKIPWAEAAKYGIIPIYDESKDHIIGFDFTIPENGKIVDGVTFWKGSDQDSERTWRQGDRIKVEYYAEYNNTSSTKFKNDASVTVGENTFKDDKEIVVGTASISKDIEEYDNYLEYEVTIDIPSYDTFAAFMGKNMDGSIPFYLKDQLKFENVKYENEDGSQVGMSYYVDNFPTDITVSARKTTGEDIAFTEDGSEEQSFHVARIGNGAGESEDSDGVILGKREFQIWFNVFTMEGATKYNSRWTLKDPCTLTVTYRIPTSATLVRKDPADSNNYVEVTDMTVRDLLDQGYTLINEIEGRGDGGAKFSTENEYTKDLPNCDVQKSATQVLEDGRKVIEYRVSFNGFGPKNAEGKYTEIRINHEEFKLEDTFDSRLKYVPGSLSVEVYAPDSHRHRYTFKYEPNDENHPLFITSEDGKTTTMTAEAAEFTNRTYRGSTTDERESLSDYMSEPREAIYVFVYQLELRDEYMTAEEIKLSNNATIYYGGEPESDQADVYFTPDVLDKKGQNILNNGEGTDIMEYTIDVNPGGTNMVVVTGDGDASYDLDSYTLTDAMDQKLTLLADTVQVFWIHDGIEEPLIKWGNSDDVNPDNKYYVFQDNGDKTFTLTLPDQKHLRITYQARINENPSQDGGEVTNNVTMDAGIEITKENTAKYKISSSSVSATSDVPLHLYKRDALTHKDIGGSTFDVYTVDESGSEADGITMTVDGKSYYAIFWKSVEPGSIDGVSISPKPNYNGYYLLLETTPPAGYEMDLTPIVFKFVDPKAKDEIEEETVTVTRGGVPYNVKVQYVGKDGNYTIIVPNTPETYELPETGGPGTLPYTMAGLLLIGSALCLMYRKSKFQKGGW